MDRLGHSNVPDHKKGLSPGKTRNEKKGSFPQVCSTYEKPPLKSSILAKC